MEERLYKFARLVDAGSYTKAAKVLHISQPALTTSIKKLERELQTELLRRGSHTFALTAAGQIAYDTAKEMGVQADNLRAKLADSANRKPDLRLGLIDGLANLLFVHGRNLPLLEQQTNLSLTVDNSSRLTDYVEHDALDIALVARPATLPASLHVIELGEEPLVLVTNKRLAQKYQTGLDNGAITDFLAYNQESHTYNIVSSYLEQRSLEVTHSFYSTSPEIMLELILEGKGTAALPLLLVQSYLADGSLCVLKTKDGGVIQRSVVGLHRKGRLLPAEVENVLHQTREELRKLAAAAAKL